MHKEVRGGSVSAESLTVASESQQRTAALPNRAGVGHSCNLDSDAMLKTQTGKH